VYPASADIGEAQRRRCALAPEEDAVEQEKKPVEQFEVVFSSEELARIDALIPQFSTEDVPATRGAVVYALTLVGLEALAAERAAR
jgi:hypothetical protein